MAKRKRKLSNKEIAHLEDVLKKYPRISVKRLAKHFGVNKPSIRKALAGLRKTTPSVIEQGSGVKIEAASFKEEKKGVPTIGVR